MNKILYILLISVSATLAIYFIMTGHFYLHKVFKPLTTILIIGFIPLFWISGKRQYNYTIITALVFCLFGDIFLMFDGYFVIGLIAFLIAHLIFIIAINRQFGFQKNYFVLTLLLAITLSYLFYLKSGLGSLLIPVFIYILVIVAMTWQAISAYLHEKSLYSMLLALGALLFLFSDCMIALNKFKYPFEASRFVILSTYWLAIFFFAYTTHLTFVSNSKINESKNINAG